MIARRLLPLVLTAASLAAAGPAALDGAGQPGRSPARIVAVGDIHGDLDAFVAILQAAQVIDSRRMWIAGRTRLVQTGDFTDRGPQVRGVMDLLMSLETQAAAAGGRVHVLLGNHETMNLMGEVRDVTPEIFATFADGRSERRREEAWTAYARLAAARAAHVEPVPPVYQPPPREEWLAERPPGYFEYREAFGPSGRYGRWLRSKPAALQLDGIVFLHGGLNPQMAPPTLNEINRQVRRELGWWDDYQRHLAARDLILPFFTLVETMEVVRAQLQAPEAAPQTGAGDVFSRRAFDARHREVLEALARIGTWLTINPNGPLWFRGFATWSSDEGAAEVARLRATYGASHFVVGHTIMSTMRITPRFDRRVFLIDTGMLASHYKGRASALEIRDGRFTAIYLDGRQTFGGTEEPDARRDGAIGVPAANAM